MKAEESLTCTQRLPCAESHEPTHISCSFKIHFHILHSGLAAGIFLSVFPDYNPVCVFPILTSVLTYIALILLDLIIRGVFNEQHNILVENPPPKKTDHFEDQGVNARIILKQMLGK
jgi:hypothetical protein